MGELIIIAIVALLALGPDKLPGAAKAIGKGIRDLKKQSRELQTTIERDTQIGDAVRDLKAALRGEDAPPPRPPSVARPATPSSGDPVPTPKPAADGPVEATAATPPATPAANVASATQPASTDAGSSDAAPRAADPPDSAHG